MNCMRNAMNMSRSNRKCALNGGSLFLILLLSTTQIACRPPDETDGNIAMDYTDYAGVDNIEWHNVKIVDGVVQEDHPVIMYKEDFVNENFKPHSRHSAKKYKDIAALRQEQQQNATNSGETQTSKPEKIYFDVLPTAPVVADDSKFDPTQITAINLLSNSTSSAEDDQSKQLLKKRPKKYHRHHHRRVRRQADTAEHNVRKRNPYYRQVYHYSTNYVVPQQNLPEPVVPQLINYQAQIFVRHPVQGVREPSKRPQGNSGAIDVPMSIGNRINDVIIFPDESNVDRDVFTTRPPSTTRRPISFWHDSDPSKVDFSLFDKAEAASTPTGTIDQTQGKNNGNGNGNTMIFFPSDDDDDVTDLPEHCQMAVKYCCSIKDFESIYGCFYVRNCHASVVKIFEYCH